MLLPCPTLFRKTGLNPAFDQRNLILRQSAAEKRHPRGALASQSTDEFAACDVTGHENCTRLSASKRRSIVIQSKPLRGTRDG